MNIFYKLFHKTKKGRFHNPVEKEPDFSSYTNISGIQEIFHQIYAPDSKIALLAANTIHVILRNECSFIHDQLHSFLKHIDFKQETFEYLMRFPVDIQESLLCLASMNQSGFIREKALKQLQSISEFNFPFILQRTGDWVKQVRNKATNIIRSGITYKNTRVFIKNYKLVEWLLNVQRVDLKFLHSEISDMLFAQDNLISIMFNLPFFSEGERFFIVKSLIHKQLFTEELLRVCLNDKSLPIRFLAIKNISPSKHREHILKALGDKSMKIRQYAIELVQDSDFFISSDHLDPLLTDESTFIRKKTRFLLQKIKNIDFHQFYIENIKANPKPGNILGLAETGTKDDIPILEKILKSDKSKNRAAAIQAISILDYEASKKIALERLNDPSNFVKKLCTKVIQRNKAKSDLPQLRKIFDIGDTDTKRITLRLISTYGGWEIAGDFLKGINESDTSLKRLSVKLLKKWVLYSGKLATEIQNSDKEYVMNAFNICNFDATGLPEETIQMIRFIFGDRVNLH